VKLRLNYQGLHPAATGGCGVPAKDLETIIRKLGSWPQEAVEYMAVILQKQGAQPR
jgi:hypothetical protein